MFFDKKLRNYFLASVSASAMLTCISAHANPEGASVVAGDVAIGGVGTNNVIIENKTARSIVEWDSFSIGTGEVTNINQVTNDAAILNRVTGGDISEIYGTLRSNGQVYLINESGILIGETGLINTNGFVASTLNMSNADFLGAGDMIFKQGIESGGGITVHGKIRSVSGGDIFLLSREITIGATAEIDANGGYVGLGAGEEILLRAVDSGDGRISIRAGKGKITNQGTIEGIAAELRAAGGNEYALAINNTGVVRAKGVSRKGGRILLTGGGKVRNTGRLKARKKVIIRSKKKIINKGQIKAGDGNKGGEIIFEAPEIEVNAGSLLDVAGALGGGRVFIGGGYRGSNADHDGNEIAISENATSVIIESGATIDASSIQSGDAGEVVVWADDETVFEGDISAQARGESGDGGRVEVSGKEFLTYRGTVSASSENGNAGRLLLDPGGMKIVTVANSTGAANEVSDADILSALSGGTSLLLSTSGAGAGDGDVTFDVGVRIEWEDSVVGLENRDTTFSVFADGDIIAADDVVIQHSEIGTGEGALYDADDDLIKVDNVINNGGGITFIAAGDIKIGSETATAGNVAIGSEFGTTLMVAGDTDFNSTAAVIDTEADGNITVTGSSDGSFSAQIGYVVKAERANNTDDDKIGVDGTATAGDVANNGNIIVAASGSVTLTGGDELGAFAQIGHGGKAEGSSVAAISSNIKVLSDVDGDGTGDVVLNHAKKDSETTETSTGTHAQIGHGSFVVSDGVNEVPLSQGSIAGNITVRAGASGTTTSNLLINTTFASSDDGAEDELLSQIGHGGHAVYIGSTVAGAEVTHGNISGDITVDINGKVTAGTTAAPTDGDDAFVIQSKIGHGGQAIMAYAELGDVASDKGSFDVVHGSIVGTDVSQELNSSEVGYTSTDIKITAAQVELIANDASRNSALSDGTIVDNSQQSQIGHGSVSIFNRETGEQFGTTGGEISADTEIMIADNRFDGAKVVADVSGQKSTLELKLDEANSELATASDNIKDLGNEITSLNQQIDELQPKVDAGTATTDEETALTDANEAKSIAAVSLSEEEETRDAINADLVALETYLDGKKTDVVDSGTESTTAGVSLDVARNVTITENRVSGNITVIDDDKALGGISLESGIAVGLTAINKDVMVTRIGHASVVGVDSLNGGEDKTDGTKTSAFNGGNVTIRQAHILGADITVDTKTLGDKVASNDFVAEDDQDISIKTSISAGLAAAEDNTAVAQIGHGADIFVSTGNGGESTHGDNNSGDGGDVTLIRGTVWDGGLVRDEDDGPEDGLSISNTTDIKIISSNEVIVDSDTAAGLAQAVRNSSESSIGHGFKTRIVTGDGGTSTGTGAAGGAGGDVLVYQGVDAREYGIDQGPGINEDLGDGLGQFDDYSYGLRGDITISATNKDGIAVNLTSDDSAALAKADFNTDISTIGHGDVLEIATGKGGDGSTGLDFEGDSNDPTAADLSELDETGQVAVYGGRGGHIDVQLGRYLAEDQYGNTGGEGMVSDTRNTGDNQADIGDTRATTLSGVSAKQRQGMSLIEGDIFVNVLGGTVNVAGSVNNALASSNHALSESVIGHAQRFTADAGDGGNAGSGNFHAQSETVYRTEQIGEEFLNYSSGTGSNRGGNGGDVRLVHGDIADRVISDRLDDDERAEITHDTDADHSGTAIEFVENEGYSQSSTLSDGSSDIYMYLHDKDVDGEAQANGDSLTVISSVNAGLRESNGKVFSTVGHHVRLIGEGGKGGDGGSSNTEFDADGNSLFADGAGQADAHDANGDVANDQDGVDETGVQAGAVYIQPNSSGGRGGDALVVNNNISGDIVINAARRVTVQSGNGHGENTIVVSSLGHTTDLFSATQAGGAAGSLIEPLGTHASYDGGIINVGGGQSADNGENAPNSGDFEHILIDGNQDDKFNLQGTDLSGDNIGADTDRHDTISEDGVAVTDSDRANGKGSTFATINAAFGTLVKDTSADPLNAQGVQKYVANADGNDVIFHDEEADPNFILDDEGDFVLNTEVNNHRYAENDKNLARFGRVVATYDGTQDQPASEHFFSVTASLTDDTPIAPGDPENVFADINPNDYTDTGERARKSLEVFVDIDRDGDVDLVDFDRDGRLDIVDVDRDGRMDVIDGRANYVDVANRNSINAVPQDGGVVNGISGLGVLDYVAVTGKGLNQATANSTGENWTNHNELKSTDLLSDYNGNSSSDFTAYVSDFSTANGGRGGDAYSQVGYSSGDISVSTGNNDKGEADSLIVKTTAPDAIVDNGSDDYLRAIIGHNAIQISDAGGESSAYRVGREGLSMESSEHSAATGGAAGDFVINGNGGRGGNAALTQGVARDHAGIVENINIVRNEVDHLVGDIFINTPNALDNTNSRDAGRISISGNIGALSPSSHHLVSQIGHSSLAIATAGNGGVGASDPNEENGSSQTELADGGDGGQAYIVENHLKGNITVMAGSDDLDGSSDFSIEMSATDGHPLVGNNLIIAQIGHGRQAYVLGGDGGNGDDGQFRANGGAGGDATLSQKAILDSVVKIDLIDVSRGYDGNGLRLLSQSVSGANDTYRVQVGHGDIGAAVAGNGGRGTPNYNVKEQRNQTANGGAGGDAIVNQAGYNYDIILDIGSNETGAEALQVLSSAGAVTNGADDHLLAAIGHGGLAAAFGGNGADGGNSGVITGIPTEVDPNLRDGDYFDRSNSSDLVEEDSDSAGVIDQGNRIKLGTTRRGGDAGDGVVNQNIGGTGRTISDRFGEEIYNDYGRNDEDGADIKITVSDLYDHSPDGEEFASGYDGVLIQTKLGKGGNQLSALHVNTAIVGHHNFAEGTGGNGGNGAPSNLGDMISDGDGGDGGSGVANIFEVRGDITIDNNVGHSGAVSEVDRDNSGTDKDTNITIETINGSASDAADHRGDARVGHMSQAQATGGEGGESAREAGTPPSFPATISTQGGDGGDAVTFQGQQEGHIRLTAENSVIVSARDTTVGAGALVAAVGHRVFAEAKAGNGNYGGTYVADPAGSAEDVAVTISVGSAEGSTTIYTQKEDDLGALFLCDGDTCYSVDNGFDEETGAPLGDSVDGAAFETVTRKSSVTNVYFTYEALREYHYRRTLGATDKAAFEALSKFEQQLVAPVTDYFENKEGELEVFLDRLIGDNIEVIRHNERDDDAIGGGDYSIPTLVDGSGHIEGAGDGEIDTLTAILAASGHGGNASVTQGSNGLSGYSDELAASGDITITAKAFDLTDVDRGITIEAVGGSIGSSFQLAHVGHQSEAHQVAAGDGKDITGRNGNANGIAGDGGDAVVDQYALNGGVDLVSNHKILVSAKDAAASAHETRAWVGHRLTIGSDYTVYRDGTSVSSGNGGDEESVPFADGHNGNGGDVFIYQRGVVSGRTRGSSDATYNTEISLAALQDSDDDNSIIVEAQAVAAPAPDVETHIGHDFLIHAVKAGDGGRQAVLSGPEGASEGLLEGNGGDIFIAQTDLGADIDIVGRDEVLINAVASAAGGNHAHLMIGHERTIGNSAESADAADGAIADNPRTGTIVAGFGGDAHIEDVNGTAMASRVAAAQGIIEDGDSGRIEIALGKLTDSYEANGDDTRLTTITSITEDVDVLSNAALGKAILEVGNQQQVIAETQSAGELQAVPFVQTAGDAGGIYINRATIDGDILIQAIDADRANSSKPTEGKQVVIDSTSASGSTAVTQIGHETQFKATTSVPVTARAAFGEDRNFLFETNLTDYVALTSAGTIDEVTDKLEEGQATLRDAQNAIEDMSDVVRALELAYENADRFPADDGVVETDVANADRGEITALLSDARTALADAKADLNDIGHGVDDRSEASAINAVMGHADELITAATAYQEILDEGIVPNSAHQIADFAEGGDIVYGALPGGNHGLNSHTDSITGIATLAHTNTLSLQHAPELTAEGFTVADTGIVEGKVDILSGRDGSLNDIDLTDVADVIGNDTIVANNFGGDTFTTDDDLDDSVVQITATADNRSLTEIGHRRIMVNTTEFGGGDTNSSPEEGGVAGDAGSIVVSNTTRGDISVQAEEVVIQTAGKAGEGEVHLLHSSHTTNTTGWSDIQALLGNGGDIINTTVISGGVSINAEQIASAVDEKDRKILATGLANTFIQMGHQAEDKNESKSDPNETGGKGDAQTNLGSNRGGTVTSSQTVTGNSNDDLVIISLDAAGDGNPTDLIIETAGKGGSDIRLGNGEDGTMKGIYQDGTSGINQSDDGGEITLTQVVSGDIEISKVEDLHINVLGEGGTSVFVGHDAEQFGQSGQVNNSPDQLQYGERVTVAQTVSGNVNVETTSTYTATLALKAGELHVGHEATQSAFSADDSANPSDFEDVNKDGVADGNGASAGGVNDSFAQPDVLATQVIEAGISIVSGEITLENLGTANQIHFGHEATHKAAVDGDLMDANGNSTGHVVASSKINSSGSDILFEAKGATGQQDDVLDHTSIHNADGDIQLDALLDGQIHVGHSSTSTMGDNTPSKAPEGQFNAEQIIGGTTIGANGEVTNTSNSIVEFRAAQDIIISSVDGETQVGHFIVETGNQTSTKDPLFVDGDATTGLADGDSELRQIVGSDIVFGSNANQGSGGVGTKGAGNNVFIATGASGRTIVGHQSPKTNEWQVEDGKRSVTVQLLDGDITIEAGTDTGVDAPNGTVLATAAAAIADETGKGDDLVLLSGGGVARIGHNMAGFDEGVLNETQRSAGDIWVRSGGDAHILGGAIGHEHYDIKSIDTSETNATPESLAGSEIRDRIRGNTTIAAGQNSSTEDSTLIADILKIDGGPKAVEINSGYGGKGNKDVDGELRFFLPAQEGLTITFGKGIAFNDSAKAGAAVPARSSSAENIFENEGGASHEHYFALASEAADYTDTFIGDGNFTFYFEVEPEPEPQPQPVIVVQSTEDPVSTQYTPTFNDIDVGSGFEIVMSDPKSGGSVNIGYLEEEGNFGTSSFEIACEEQGTNPEDCKSTSESHKGQSRGVGSNANFAGTAGGNQSIERVFDQEVTNTVNRVSSNEAGYFVRPTRVSTPITYEYAPKSIAKIGVKQKVKFGTPRLGTFTEFVRSFRTKKVAKSVAAYQGHIRSAAPTTLSDSYGEYVAGVAINTAQVEKNFPDSLSYASSFLVYKQQ